MKTILITGATGAIGSAIAKSHSGSKTKLILHGRNKQLLENVAEHCRELKSQVLVKSFDLKNTKMIFKWVNKELLGENLPDIVFANAGVSSNNTASKGEAWKDMESVIDVNIKSVFALLNDLIPAMLHRGSGKIVLISSLAGYYGLPNTPSYSASKAAIKTYGEALQTWLSPIINVTVVMPGDIKSKMYDEMEGPSSFLMYPDKAAEIIKKGVSKNKPRIAFPFPVSMGAWLLTLLPNSWACFFLKLLGYRLK